MPGSWVFKLVRTKKAEGEQMKRKYKVTVNGLTCITLEAWSSGEAARVALRDHIALTQHMGIGQIDTITIERVA